MEVESLQLNFCLVRSKHFFTHSSSFFRLTQLPDNLTWMTKNLHQHDDFIFFTISRNLFTLHFFPTAVPDPPENLKWRDKSGKSIFLSWEPPKYDGGAHIKGYVVDKCQRGTDKWEPCGDPIPELK